jgi:hypothetical protein
MTGAAAQSPGRGDDAGISNAYAWVTDPEGNRMELWQPA